MTSAVKENQNSISGSFWTEPSRGLLSWIFSTDHKRIGLLYLHVILILFGFGVVLGLLMRLELIAPGRTIMGPQTYNATFTLHGVIMIFLVVIPSIPTAAYRGQRCGVSQAKPFIMVAVHYRGCDGINQSFHRPGRPRYRMDILRALQ
jgi:hypothetical protein